MNKRLALFLTIVIGVFIAFVIAAMPTETAGRNISKGKINSPSVVSSSLGFRQGEKAAASKVQGGSHLTKAEIIGGRLYLATLDAARKTATLISTSLARPSDIEQLLLPQAVDGDPRFLKWKIHNGSVYSISVVGLPTNKTFTLVSASLQNLRSDPPKMAPLGSGGLHRFKDTVVTVGPLTTAAIVAESLEGHDMPKYDFIVGDRGQYNFFIQQDGHLHRWRYEKETGWIKVSSADFTEPHDFTVNKDNGNIILITKGGNYYLVEDDKLTLIGNNGISKGEFAHEKSYLIINSITREFYFQHTGGREQVLATNESVLYKDRQLAHTILPPQLLEAMQAVLAAAEKSKN